MKKEYRVKKNQDFERIIHQRKSVANRFFVVYYAPNSTHLHVGFSVSKKLGKAVVRNKVKRQVRMMAMDILDSDRQCDFVIIVRKQYLQNDFATNKKQLQLLIGKINKRMDY